MNKKHYSSLELSVAGDALEEKPQFSLEIASVLPLQVTLTKTSLQLIKTLVEVRINMYVFRPCSFTKSGTLMHACHMLLDEVVYIIIVKHNYPLAFSYTTYMYVIILEMGCSCDDCFLINAPSVVVLKGVWKAGPGKCQCGLAHWSSIHTSQQGRHSAGN